MPRLKDLVEPESSASTRDHYSGTGSLYARDTADLGPKQTGVLAHVAVDEGDRVKKGQVLFRLDPALAGLQVKQAKAGLAAAQVAQAGAELEFQRTEALFQKGSVAPAMFDRAKSARDQAQAEVERAKVMVSLSNAHAGDVSVRSPIDGVVTKKFKNVGETVTLMPPTVVLVVQDLEKLELRAELPETALPFLTPSALLKVTVPALGVVRSVPLGRVGATVNPRTRTVEVVGEIDNTDGTLKPGMMAEVTVDRAGKGGRKTEGKAQATKGASVPHANR